MNFVVFSDDWGRHPSSCQHVFGRIARDHPVTWVNTIGMRRPSLGLLDMRRGWQKLTDWTRHRAEPLALPENTHIVSPIMVPFYGSVGTRTFNTRQVIKAVGRHLRRRRLADPIVVTTVPNVCDCIGRLGERLSVYYCVDDFTEWPGLEQDLLMGMERRLLERVDMVWATADRLRRTRSTPNGPTRLLPHGVDVEHFAQAAERGAPPEELSGVAKPILGLFGLLDARLDLELVRQVARRRPDWSWVFVGPTQLRPGALDELPNLHWIGPVSYARLPAVAAGFDVCVLPYVVNELTASINPLKLREYLATGKPVVCTPIAEAARLRDCLDLAGDADEWIGTLKRALGGDVPPEQRSARRRELDGADWQSRADQALGWIAQQLTASSESARVEAVGR